MKKYTLNFGEFKQFDKVFLTADNGIDCASVTSVASVPVASLLVRLALLGYQYLH